MNRIHILLLTVFILSSCYNQRPEKNIETYTEADLPVLNEDPLWENTGKGLHASFGSIDLRYARHKVPMESVVKDKRFVAWKGEKINAQIVLWSVTNVKQVECVWEPLTNSNGDTIDASHIKTRYVRYVLSDEYGEGCGTRSKDANTVQLVGDVLDELPGMNMDPKTVRPVWISIDVPETAQPGVYTSSLKIFSRKNSPQELRFTLDVQNKVLSSSEDRTFHLNIKQEPLAIALWHDVKPWSQDHFDLMRPYIKMLAEAGQKSVSCLLYEGVDEHRAFSLPTSMITWTKTKQGKWKYDFSILERWIRFMGEMGIDKHINLYSILPQNKQLFYYDEVSGENKLLSLQVDSRDRRGVLKSYFTKLSNFLSERGWLSKTSIVIEDKNQEYLTDFIYWMRQYEPEFRITLITKRYRPELLDSVQHLGLSAQYITAESMIEMKKAEGVKTSLAIDCDLERPNMFSFSSPAEASWFGWFAAAHGLDGMYFDGFNNWTPQPLKDGRSSYSPAGAGFLIYPECRSSIRFERLKEGIQDFEKISILLKDLTPAEQKELQRLLARFTVHRMDDHEAANVVMSGRELLNQLSQKHE